MTNPGLSMWNGSSKTLYFMDFWHSFCWRPWMLLSTKSKGHKSNVRISWMYRFCFYDLKVHFWWPNKCLKYIISSLNTLYYLVVLNLCSRHQEWYLLLYFSPRMFWMTPKGRKLESLTYHKIHLRYTYQLERL